MVFNMEVAFEEFCESLKFSDDNLSKIRLQ